MVRGFFDRLRLGTLFLGGFTMMIFGAAGYATFAENHDDCKHDASSDVYTVSSYAPEVKH